MRRYVIVGFGQYYAGHGGDAARWTKFLKLAETFPTRAAADAIAVLWAAGLVEVMVIDITEKV